MDFETVIMRLNQFWSEHGCLLWQPHNVQVGAGTLNPATALRVLGPEPWSVAYVEPSVRPADGRYGKNPNRWQKYYQYQVILQPEPGNPQELYLASLRALGIDPAEHDVRFVEDNWESPALGAWGLGWEVWLDGQEITQFTYFQQAGGQELDPVAVEITYGLERIVMVLQGVSTFPEIKWHGDLTYGDLRLQGEIEHCTYNFEVADVDNLHALYDLYEAEAQNAINRGLVMPAHDYVLKCSHVFNVLDARGAVGVTERARYFVRMRNLARTVASLYVEQRKEMGYPMLRANDQIVEAPLPTPVQPEGDGPFDFVLELGIEELPVGDLDVTVDDVKKALEQELTQARLSYDSLIVEGTPRRVAAIVKGLQAAQQDRKVSSRGPAAAIAFKDGQPTKAAEGFARGKGIDPTALEVREVDGKEYVFAITAEKGQPAAVVLAEALPRVFASLHYTRNMRWNERGISFSRPVRWIIALLGDVVVPCEFAGVRSGRVSRGIRPADSPAVPICCASAYEQAITEAGIMLSQAARRESILEQARALAAEVGGEIPDDEDLLSEVTNLVEYPLAIRGSFDEQYLRLPDMVLLAVMRKHQRYLPVLKDGKLLPYYITIANGASLDVDVVRHGNDEVLRARYADAAYFYDSDIKKPLADYTPALNTLTFQEKLGSVLDKVHRMEKLVPVLADTLGLNAEEKATAERAAAICKSDLATQLVVELTSLQGELGRHYAEHTGETPAVAQAIAEHYLPRFTGDRLPASKAGLVVGLADRLDSLVGLFAVGIKPSSGADPWGLRRAALSIVQTLSELDMSISLREAIKSAAANLPVKAGNGLVDEVLDFVQTRYRVALRDAGYAYDQVDAVLNAQVDNPAAARHALDELAVWVGRDDWGELLDSYARCVRITRKLDTQFTVNPGLFSEEASRQLYASYAAQVEGVSSKGTVDALMEAIQALKPAITAFFDQVLVMDPNQDIRNNRLGLLQAVSGLAEGIVDLTAMEGF